MEFWFIWRQEKWFHYLPEIMLVAMMLYVLECFWSYPYNHQKDERVTQSVHPIWISSRRQLWSLWKASFQLPWNTGELLMPIYQQMVQGSDHPNNIRYIINIEKTWSRVLNFQTKKTNRQEKYITWNNSGAAYGGEPQNVLRCWSICETWVANPKSPTFTSKQFSDEDAKKTFSAFKSRWIQSFSCCVNELNSYS